MPWVLSPKTRKAGQFANPNLSTLRGALQMGVTVGSEFTVKGRKRHILVDTLGLSIANRVEAADVSDRRAGALLTSGLKAIFPAITTVIADAGHESKKLAQVLAAQQGWRLQIVKTPS